MRRAPPIELNAEELTALQRTVRSSRSSVREVFRARIVLLAAEGLENRDIAEQLGTGPDTVSKWRRRFAQQRLSGLVDRPGRGRKPHYGREIIERIVGDTVHRKPEQATHWSTRTMAQHADSGPTRSPNPAQADHRFRFNPITDSGRTRSPIPVSSRSLFRGGRNRSGRLV